MLKRTTILPGNDPTGRGGRPGRAGMNVKVPDVPAARLFAMITTLVVDQMTFEIEGNILYLESSYSVSAFIAPWSTRFAS
jgi:hypothetical protein